MVNNSPDKYELRSQVAAELGCSESGLIWSEKSGNPKTMYHDEEKGTNAFREMGYWVKGESCPYQEDLQ